MSAGVCIEVVSSSLGAGKAVRDRRGCSPAPDDAYAGSDWQSQSRYTRWSSLKLWLLGSS